MSDSEGSHEDHEGVDQAILQAYDAIFAGTHNYVFQDAPDEVVEVVSPIEQLPTPPEERRASISRQAPARLTPQVPPANFGAVIPSSIYRGSFPLPENFSFMKSLKLKTILTLVPEPYPEPYVEFLQQHGIRQIVMSLPANKEVVKIEAKAIMPALGVLLDRANHPVLIHCNKGKHRTGCLTASFRKVLGEDLDTILHEYQTYAGIKARPLDVEFITSFDELALLWMARDNGFLPEDEPRLFEPGVSSLKTGPRTRG